MSGSLGFLGLTAVPGLVDLHVHFREPGFPQKEDIASGMAAARAGGFACVCMMPNTRPPIDSVETLLAVDAKGSGSPCLGLAASAMTIGQAGKELVDFAAMDAAPTLCKELTGHGVCGISEDGMTLADEGLMERVCREAARLDLPVMDHCEPETETILRDIALANRTGARFHIQHVSRKASVAAIRRAKRDGVPVTCETAPHYFALNGSSGAKMNPPLGSEEDRLAIIEGLRDGTIDCIATDHAPHEKAVKEGIPYEQVANGVIGLETSLAVSYTTLVAGGYLLLEDLVRLMSTRPAEIIGLPRGALGTLLLDVETEYAIDREGFLSKGRNTPFDGMLVRGRILEWKNGTEDLR
ncbi:MAG: dihydroorotase [Clostridiales Family XIII bacterium]|jgi:dihydroorotase|nr:dihydroorotase [Clostridiales Family XIII bacterium]